MHHAIDIVINIQLPYDPSTPMEPELWDRSFYSISLHGSIEHLALDLKNIKDSLNFMTKYISNKQVDLSKFNNFENFYGVGKAVWNFISSIYQANCVRIKKSELSFFYFFFSFLFYFRFIFIFSTFST